jgi:hypothetical protein
MGIGCTQVVARRVTLAGGAVTNTVAVVCLAALAAPWPVMAQPQPCRILCAPELKIEPTFTIERLAQRPRMETLDNGSVVESSRATRESVFELIFAVDVPTQIPRVGLTLEAIFVPFGEVVLPPVDGAAGAAASPRTIRDNGIEIESELNVSLFDTEQTRGWVSSHLDIVDKFSPAEQPSAGSVFTHKLNFEWDTAFHIFKSLPEGNWLRNVEAEVSLDYLATGLPKAGDIVGDERFVDKASPWSLSFVFVMPLAPLVP